MSNTTDAAREEARTQAGEFGTQLHAESGIVDVTPEFSVPDYFLPMGVDHEGAQSWTLATEEGIEEIRLFPNGAQSWTLNGQLHRVGGPALVSLTGRGDYFDHGQRHRPDGPAQKGHDGTDLYFLHGVNVKKSDICTATPKQVVSHLKARSLGGRLDQFNGWDKPTSWVVQTLIVRDALEHVVGKAGTAPFVEFPAGSDSTPMIGFWDGPYAVAQYRNQEDLTEDPDAIGEDQVTEIATALLDIRNHMIADYRSRA